MRVSFLVDGFNLYHSLKQASKDEKLGRAGTRWLDLTSFCRAYLPSLGASAQVASVQYFSALATHIQKKSGGTVARHQEYIKCLEDQGVEVVLGRFKKNKSWCPSCSTHVPRNEEKETDVAIAVHLLELFALDTCDMAMLVTGDTDLAPAVRVAQRLYPTKQVGFLFPYRRKNNELAQLTPHTINVSRKAYLSNQFPDPLVLSDGSNVRKPTAW